MNFAMIGAGGIGCYYGVKLIDAGHNVHFIARGEHLKAMQNNGLTVTHPSYEFHQQVLATSLEKLVESSKPDSFDLIILTVKSGATQAVLQQLKDWLSGSETPVLSLQNGVDNEIAIANAIGEKRTVGGLAVRVGGHVVEPGHVHAQGIAQIVLGCWPNVDSDNIVNRHWVNALGKQFDDAGIPTTVTKNIQHELWKKLLINNAMNPLSAVTGHDTRTLTHHPLYAKTARQLMTEVQAVAAADQVVVTDQDVQEMFDLISGFDAIKTSMLVDKEKGRTLELDAISGAVLTRAETLGINIPATNLLHAILSEYNVE